MGYETGAVEDKGLREIKKSPYGVMYGVIYRVRNDYGNYNHFILATS